MAWRPAGGDLTYFLTYPDVFPDVLPDVFGIILASVSSVSSVSSPCAGLIGEISFYAFGFEKGRHLAKKMVLCSVLRMLRNASTFAVWAGRPRNVG